MEQTHSRPRSTRFPACSKFIVSVLNTCKLIGERARPPEDKDDEISRLPVATCARRDRKSAKWLDISLIPIKGPIFWPIFSPVAFECAHAAARPACRRLAALEKRSNCESQPNEPPAPIAFHLPETENRQPTTEKREPRISGAESPRVHLS